LMYSASTDPELRDWLRWASDEGNAPAFVRRVAEAAQMACSPDDHELFGWLCWACGRGHTPSFVRALVEAAFRACAGDYALLRPVLLELKRRHPEGRT
jgi:hypothetical protein